MGIPIDWDENTEYYRLTPKIWGYPAALIIRKTDKDHIPCQSPLISAKETPAKPQKQTATMKQEI